MKDEGDSVECQKCGRWDEECILMVDGGLLCRGCAMEDGETLFDDPPDESDPWSEEDLDDWIDDSSASDRETD